MRPPNLCALQIRFLLHRIGFQELPLGKLQLRAPAVPWLRMRTCDDAVFIKDALLCHGKVVEEACRWSAYLEWATAVGVHKGRQIWDVFKTCSLTEVGKARSPKLTRGLAGARFFCAFSDSTWEWRLDHLQNHEIKVESLRLARETCRSRKPSPNGTWKLVSFRSCLFYHVLSKISKQCVAWSMKHFCREMISWSIIQLSTQTRQQVSDREAWAAPMLCW